VVQGDQDELVDFATVQSWARGFEDPPEFAKMPGAEHFFHGRLGELRGVVMQFLSGKQPVFGG
jgi:alpha/beta superfamily hydrolase